MAGKISEIATPGAPAQEADRFEATRDPTGAGAGPSSVWLDVGDLLDAVRIDAQTGSTFTLALTNANGIVTMDSASANTVTIPTNASVAFTIGTSIEIVQAGAGATTIEGDTGVTLNGTSAGSVVISRQYGVFRLVKVDTDEWVAELSESASADPDTLLADTTDELQVGFSSALHAAGTKSSGTYTPDEADGAMQSFTNGGAFTLAPPANNCSLLLQGTNNASAGTITTSGFTIVTGDSLTTTDGDDFLFYISKIGSFSHLHVVALQ